MQNKKQRERVARNRLRVLTDRELALLGFSGVVLPADPQERAELIHKLARQELAQPLKPPARSARS